VALPCGDSLRKLVSFGSPRSYVLFMGMGVLAAKIHQQLMEVYGTDVMSRQQVAKWCLTFAFGRDNAMDSNQSG